MNDIILSTQNGEPVASSRDVAKRFGKRHDHVIRDIAEIVKSFPKNGDPPLFFKTEFFAQSRTFWRGCAKLRRPPKISQRKIALCPRALKIQL